LRNRSVSLFTCICNRVKAALDRGEDRLFYRRRHVYRQILSDFAGKMSDLNTVKEIADALLGPIARAIHAKQAGLLLPVKSCYATKYIVKLNEEDSIAPLMLQLSSPLIRYLASEGKPVFRRNRENSLQLSEFSEEDRQVLDTSRVEVLCPIISKHQLLGILVLCEKYPQGHYSPEDIDLMATLARQAAVAMENVRISASAREKADTDGLTGLRNHRYFQESLNKVIEGSAVSGDDFALLIIDLDLFKIYNDIYGHILGDQILKDFGNFIKSTIRDTDVGARYGGDEFACILVKTDSHGARKVAERIRRKMETYMEQKGIIVTCSIGVSGWRTDGVTREKIVAAAFQALSHAKRSGGNRVCLAGKLDAAEKIKLEKPQKTVSNKAVESIVYALAATVDTRDHYTYGHSKAVSRYAAELARAAGYSKKAIQRIRSAGLLHDIGKLNLPDSILTKRDPLTDEEWDMIKRHPEVGARILKYIESLSDCMDAVLFHHERYDGQGYPRGLKGEDIPLDARIMAIADSYDAMISERGYKERKSAEEAIEELEACSGTQFDPGLVHLFIKIRRKSLTPAIELNDILLRGSSESDYR
jgi:diguanylate cyclase (GGDEF)-like protein/putative nucleotidyltransferase with HDIG domain